MRKVLIYALSLVLIFTLVGCGSDDEQVVDQNAETGELSGDVTVWSWDVAAKSLEDAAVEFNKIHPDVNIIVEDLGTDQVYDRLLTRLASNTGLPDIVTMEGERVATYAANFPEGFVDLTDEVDTDDFLSAKIAEVTHNDKIVGFPWDGAPGAIFYRADIFEEAGINSEDIKSWDDFIEEGKKLEILDDDVKMIQLPASTNPTFYGMLYQQTGSYFFDEDGNTSLNTENGIKATNTLKKLYDSGITYDTVDWDGLVSATREGKIATVVSAVWWTGTLIDEVPDSAGDWRVMPLPIIEEGLDYGAVNGGSNIMIPDAAPNKEAAIEFAKFAMTDVPTQISMFSNYGLYPSYKPAYDDPIFDEEVDYFGGQQVWRFFADQSDNLPEINYSENFSEAFDQIRDLETRILVGGEDVESSLDSLQESFVNNFGQ